MDDRDDDGNGVDRSVPAIVDEFAGKKADSGDELTPRLRLFRQLCTKIPKNEYGLPKFLYRPDLIPADFSDYPESTQARILENASISLVYDEGYPCYENGQAIWTQMAHEPSDAHDAFTTYLKLAEMYGIRRLELIPQEAGVAYPSLMMRDWNINYFWAARAKAFDLFEVAAQRKLIEKRVLTTRNSHYLAAERLLAQLMQYFDQVDPDTGESTWLMELNPKMAFDALDKLARLQRTALGLNENNKGEPSDGPRHADVSVLLRTMVRNSQGEIVAGEGGHSNNMHMLDDDPDTAALAQELIIKLQRGELVE